MKINTPRSIALSERRWVFWMAVIGMLITTLPYFLGFSLQGDAWRFTGFVFGVNDGNSYIAKMRAGAEGDWLFRTPYSSLEQQGILAYFPLIVLGKLTSPPAQHEQLVVLYHLFRFVGGILAIWATYDFISYFIFRINLRRLGTLLACFGGGLGWLLVLLGQGHWLGSLPLDFFSPETFGFLSIYGLPHLAVARALLLWGLLAYLQGDIEYPISNLCVGSGATAGLIWLVMGFFQPLTIAIAWAAMGAHLAAYGLYLAGKRVWIAPADFQPWLNYFRRAVVAGAISAPFVLYSFLALRGDPFLQSWTAQNTILSPPPLYYLLAYGLVLPLSITGAVSLIRKSPPSGWFLVGWVILLPALAYAPFNLQRRLPEGIWVALVVLAMAGLDRVEKPARGWYVPLALTFPTTLLLLFGGITGAMGGQTPIYRPTPEIDAFLFLDGKVQTGDLVLSAFETGNALPAWAPVRVVIGHGPEGVGLAALLHRVEAFFQSVTEDTERQALLDELGVHYVFWGPSERALGGWDPHSAVYLKEIYSKNGYSIFINLLTHR